MEDTLLPDPTPIHPDDLMDMYLSIWQCPACATLTRLIDLTPSSHAELQCPVCMAVVVGEDDA